MNRRRPWCLSGLKSRTGSTETSVHDTKQKNLSPLIQKNIKL